MEDLHRKELRCGRSAAEGNCAFLRIRRVTGGNAGNMGAVTVVVGNIRVLIGIVIGKRNLPVDVHTGGDCQRKIILGQSAGLRADTKRILERLVGGKQTGVEHRDHHARAVKAIAHCLIIAGEVVGNHDLLVGGLQLRCGIAVGNVDRLNAVNVRDLVQIAVSDIAGEAVEQRGEFIGDLIVDTAHRLADVGVLILQLGAGVGSLGGAALGYVSLGGAFQHHDGTDDFVVGVLIGVVGLELLALKALCFLQDSLRALGACDFRDLGLVCREGAAYARQNHDQSQQHRENALEVFHGFVFLSNFFALGQGCRDIVRGAAAHRCYGFFCPPEALSALREQIVTPYFHFSKPL